MSYPQNGDRIVTIDSVTSIHPVHNGICYTASQYRTVNLILTPL